MANVALILGIIGLILALAAIGFGIYLLINERKNVGPQGNEGPQGVIGPQGPANGPQGVIGPQGVTGPQGRLGPQGVDGPTGVQGPVGNDGPTGPQGVLGPTGPQGLTGKLVGLDSAILVNPLVPPGQTQVTVPGNFAITTVQWETIPIIGRGNLISNNTDYVAPVTGLYQFNLNLNFIGGNQIFTALWVNGQPAEEYGYASTGRFSTSGIIQLRQGDLLSVRVGGYVAFSYGNTVSASKGDDSFSIYQIA
jgi:hypothetical protein